MSFVTTPRAADDLPGGGVGSAARGVAETVAAGSPPCRAVVPGDLRGLNAALTEQVRLFEAALENMSQGLCMFDARSRLMVSNPRYREIFGLPPGVLAPGMTQEEICAMLITKGCYPPSVTLDGIRDSTQHALQLDGGRPVLRELADGRILSVLYRAMAGGGWVSTFEDVTEQRRSEARIAQLAHRDALTDLANIAAMRARYGALVTAVEAGLPLLAMSYVDLDGFKAINDVHGHAVGDELLVAVADRLRTLAGGSDVVARLGGDEFAVLRRVRDEGAAEILAKRLAAALSGSYALSTGRVEIRVSVGVATDAVGEADLDALMHDADLALRHAKAERHGAVKVFDAAMSDVARARRRLEAELHAALAEDQFELHYQTLVDVGDMRISGVEALVRWRHPERGLVPPLSFIPVMEEVGLIVPLGRWVLERACRDAMLWPDRVSVAVNVSSVQMRLAGFADTVLAVLAETGLPARRLEIEITESALLEEGRTTLDNLAVLHGADIRLAMDDFGTGYSSLSYLRRFPIDKIKIDRSFMKDAETSPDARAIIRAVAGLGVSLGIETLVEGVETEQQFDLARAEGVGQVQGYLFGRPQPEAAVSRLIAGEASGANR